MGQNKIANLRTPFPFIILAVLGLGLIAYRSMPQIEAKLWHWRHGYVCQIGTYDVFVPDHWLPRHYIPDNLLLYDTKGGSGVQIFLSPPLHELGYWENWHRQKLESDHVKEVVDHTLNVGSQKVVCVGGTEFQDELKFSAPNVISLECQSTGTLTIIFVGKDSELPAFYSLTSQIKEHG